MSRLFIRMKIEGRFRVFRKRLEERFARPGYRITLVLAVAVLSFSTALPNYLSAVFPIYGHFGFVTDENWRVEASWRKPLKAGDVIDWRRLPFSQRFDTGDFGRMARIGTRVAFPVIREGKRLNVVLVSEYHAERFGGSNRWWIYGFKKGSELLIVLLGVALVLIRPTKLSALFFLYVVALATDGPVFWSFLPAGVYVGLLFVASIVAFPLPPIALTFFALEISDERTSAWRVAVRGLTLSLFGLGAALIAAWIAREHFAIVVGNWIPSVATAVLVTLWTLAVVVLVAEAASAWRRHAHALTLACGALTASALCYLYIDATSLLGSNVIGGSNDFWALLSLVLSLAAVYPILCGCIIDERLYITRAALSAAIGLSILLASSLLNVIFVAQIARAPFVVPIEILVAALLGFWLSGARDVAAATSLITNEAPNARLRGNRIAERDCFVRALASAERTHNSPFIATVRAHAAFCAWFAGDDEEFESHVRALQHVMGNRPVRALGRFATIRGTERIAEVPPFGELPEWTARTALVLCGYSNDSADAKTHANVADAAAEASGDPFLKVVAIVALAETSPDNRIARLDEARRLVRSAGWLALDKALTALCADAPELGPLQAFVDLRLRKQRPVNPLLSVSFATGVIRSNGAVLNLSDKERELLFTVASRQSGVRADELMDRLWPNADGDAARNAFKVCLHRLRKHAGDLRIVHRVGQRYELLAGADVDIWRFQDAIDAHRAAGAPQTLRELLRIRQIIENGSPQRVILRGWFWRFELELDRMRHECERVIQTPVAAVKV